MAINYEKLFNKTNINFEELKKLKLDVGTKVPSRGLKENFNEHIEMLEKEFHQQTLLEFYSVWLIVKIRRKLNLDNSLEQFFKLWSIESDFLIDNLSSRWLISVCDTFIDYAKESDEIAYAFAVLFFMNTIKLYETENCMYSKKNSECDPELLTAKVQLFDGVTAYNAKGGDMIKNMYSRLNLKSSSSVISAHILRELVQRNNNKSTVYGRMSIHQQNLEHRW